MSDEITILTFRMHGELYGLPISSIRVLESMVPFTPIQGKPDHLIGIANLRGQIISIVDIEKVFDLEPQKHEKKYLIVLKSVSQLLNMEQYSFNDDVLENQDILSIRVGNINGMAYFNKNDLDTDLNHLGKQKRSFVWGIVKTQSNLITVFDPAVILQYCQNTLFSTEFSN